jgi:hypothetical protein
LEVIPVRIVLRRSGGFAAVPALSADVVLDTDDVVPHVREELDQFVASLDFGRLRAGPTAYAGSADHINYELTVIKGDDESSASFTSPISDPVLQRLVTRVEQIARGIGPDDSGGQNRDEQ